MVVRTSVKVMKFLVQIFAPFCVGINVTTSMGLTVTCKAMLLLCSADLPARALISNMKQYNGFHACSICTDPGSHTTHHIWPYTDTNTLRTQTDTYKAIMAAVRQEEPVSVAKNFKIVVVCSTPPLPPPHTHTPFRYLAIKGHQYFSAILHLTSLMEW